ncbi:hypothetical protein EJ04DRAFT_514726 [Polyplosphaeria fusca]|uniref:Wings apart-like protein C-terminal domain-containing protein n=1 Tax=Polyplosphaeria fusca TaxID=682080 RepID=A0A9P4UZK9_9PLEO|nr:hypothetical protein EJ04DRAFT_514726 [Polyplosphaeria fusca]
MAMAAMSSAFTTSNRRKKLATYGKSSRLASSAAWAEDATSPERPRKQAGLSVGLLQKPVALHGKSDLLRSRAPGTSPATDDVFDVPSDDDPLQSPSRPKTNTAKGKAAIDEFDVPVSDDDSKILKSRPKKVPQLSRKPAAVERTQPTIVNRISNTRYIQPVSSREQNAPLRKRSKTPQPASAPNTEIIRASIKSNTDTMARTTPASRAPPSAATHKKTTSKETSLARKPLVKPPSDVDIFDIPASDDEAPARTPRRSRPPPLPRAKSPFISQSRSALTSPGTLTSSDDSSSSKKRKRNASSQSTAAETKTDTMATTGMPKRSAKYSKKNGSIFPGHDASVQNQASASRTSSFAPDPVDSAINKPKRTRVRTMLGQPVRAPVAKGKSSPARLHDMLAVRSLSRPSATSVSTTKSTPQSLGVTPLEEDETMYDIPGPATPRVQGARPIGSGSVTPRQKAMFGNLLGEQPDMSTPGMPSISRLQLTDRRSNKTLTGLLRSSSDITPSTSARKSRLIDTLIQAAPPLEEDTSESDEESEDEVEDMPTEMQAPVSKPSAPTLDKEMDLDREIPVNSQSSQNAHGKSGSTKVTYANNRSILEEKFTSEAQLLAAFTFEDFEAKKPSDLASDEDDDPASQVRGIHELRTQGKNQRFQMEAQTSIDDIRGKSGLGSSGRRSAMIDMCTRMADSEFMDQLLDSSLVQQLIENLGSTGEVIFDFAALAAVAFIVKTNPGYAILEQILGASVMTTFGKLLAMDTDINRLAKERKANLSRIGRESVSDLATLVQKSPIWTSQPPAKISPQLVAIQSLELLIVGLRQAGSTGSLLDEDVVLELLSISSPASKRTEMGNPNPQDVTILNTTFSLLEAISVSDATWSNKSLHSLVEMVPVFFNASASSPIRLALRLCMNITNNKPKACENFSGPAFVQPLVRSISHRFSLLAGELEAQERVGVLDDLLLSLGVMINLAEFSDKVRTNVVANGEETIDALTKTFLQGSERAAQASRHWHSISRDVTDLMEPDADSLEVSQANVTVGYLAVLLGNLCLNASVRRKVQRQLPGHRLDTLVGQIREFVRYNEEADRETKKFEGEEGRETWQNFTGRLLQVVAKLEGTHG